MKTALIIGCVILALSVSWWLSGIVWPDPKKDRTP